MDASNPNILILAEICYVSRDDEKDFSRHWQIFRPSEYTHRLQNDRQDIVELKLCGVWNLLTKPARLVTWWNTRQSAENYLRKIADPVAITVSMEG